MLEQITTLSDKYLGWGGWATQVFIVAFFTLLLDFFQKRAESGDIDHTTAEAIAKRVHLSVIITASLVAFPASPRWRQDRER